MVLAKTAGMRSNAGYQPNETKARVVRSSDTLYHRVMDTPIAGPRAKMSARRPPFQAVALALALLFDVAVREGSTRTSLCSVCSRSDLHLLQQVLLVVNSLKITSEIKNILKF